MFSVMSNCRDVFVPRREVHPMETVGVGNWASALAHVFPNGVWIRAVINVEMVEVRFPVFDIRSVWNFRHFFPLWAFSATR